MAKQYNNVLDMVKDIVDDKEFCDDLEKGIAERELANLLFSIRCAGNLTQREMAVRTHCTQGKISKLECASTKDIRVSDLEDYARELGLQLSIVFDRKKTAAESVKHHVLALRKHLDLLASLAHKDDKILEGVQGFFLETLLNALNVIFESADKLPKSAQRDKRLMSVSGPVLGMPIRAQKKPRKDCLASR